MSVLTIVLVLTRQDGETQRRAGDEWLFEGPGTYIPKVEVDVLETVRATVVRVSFLCSILFCAA